MAEDPRTSGSRRGPAPKPTALKVLHGDYKGRPSARNTREPKPTKREIKPPAKMSNGAREVWDEIAPMLIEIGILTPPDAKIFAEFCEATVIVQIARAQIARMLSGEYEPKPGAANPFNSYARAVITMTNLGGRYGLTPSDRSRLIVEREQTHHDDLISNG
jgi:P27 family predicted phage terminase small subunit